MKTPPPKPKGAEKASGDKLHRASRLPSGVSSAAEASPAPVVSNESPPSKPASVKKTIKKNKKAPKPGSKASRPKAAPRKTPDASCATDELRTKLKPSHRLNSKQTPGKEPSDDEEGAGTEQQEAGSMSSHIAEALARLGAADKKKDGKKVVVLVEDDETKAKRKNKKNSFYRSLISHLVFDDATSKVESANVDYRSTNKPL